MRQLKTSKCLSGRKIYVGNYGDHSFRENLEMFFFYSARKEEILNQPFSYKLSFFFSKLYQNETKRFSVIFIALFSVSTTWLAEIFVTSFRCYLVHC